MEKQPALNTNCHLCGLEVAIPELNEYECANCPRCGHSLTRFHPRSAEKTLAWAFSALFFLLLSLPFEFLSFSSNGQERDIAISTGLQTLAKLDFYSLAVITALATLVIPAIVMLGILVLSFCRLFYRPTVWLQSVHHLVQRLIPWSMAEIFLVGTLVSLIKIADMATVNIGMSFSAFCLFIASLCACFYYFDRLEFAHWLDIHNQQEKPLTILEKTISIQRTWALLLTATLLYIPANIYPIMYTEFFGSVEANTILGGVISLWQSDSYPVAVIIFLASVVIPIAKLFVLAWLNWSVVRGSSSLQTKRSMMYKITEWIGRWSMIDVFVVAILVALIQLGSTISIYPGFAALAFCAVVFFTMLAAITFDSRLIWPKDKAS